MVLSAVYHTFTLSLQTTGRATALWKAHQQFFLGGGQGDGLIWNLAWKIISSPQIRNRIIIQGLVLEEVVCVIPQQ